MVLVVEIKIGLLQVGDGVLDCFPHVPFEEREKLERDWMEEVKYSAFVLPFHNKKEMKQAIRRVATFWRKRGFKIIWKWEEEEAGIDLAWEVVNCGRDEVEVDWEAMREEAATALMRGMEIEVRGRKFLVLFLW